MPAADPVAQTAILIAASTVFRIIRWGPICRGIGGAAFDAGRLRRQTMTTNDHASGQAFAAKSHRFAGVRSEEVALVGLTASVALVFGWIGAMKFTAYEAGGIEGLVASSPLTSWAYEILSVRATAAVIGVIEIVLAIGLVIGLRVPEVGRAAAAGVAATLVLTLSFILTAPGWEASLGGFPALSIVPGQFLLKDVVLLAAAIFLVVRHQERIGS